VVFTGEYFPFIAGGSLFAYAKLRNDREVLGASFAVLQASLIEFLYNSALKAVTGRPNPDWRHVSDMDSLSRTFRFGFLRGGVFWGWPSGHTAATMAVVSALTSYYPDKTWLKVVGFGLVGYTMFGVSANNRGGMHWFSDALAGALMSYAVGSTVGKYYRNAYSGQTQTSSLQPPANPSMGFNPTGITVTFMF
jgi:membrane-associated phospholipid phosphatase